MSCFAREMRTHPISPKPWTFSSLGFSLTKSQAEAKKRAEAKKQAEARKRAEAQKQASKQKSTSTNGSSNHHSTSTKTKVKRHKREPTATTE